MPEVTSTKDRLTTALDALLKPGGSVLKNTRGDKNYAATLGQMFILQEMENYAAALLKAHWRELLTEELIDSDDELRKQKGERIVLESNRFSMLASVSKSRENFDKEKFIEEVSKKFDIDQTKLTTLSTTCLKEGKPSLSKKILEAA